MTLSEQVLRGGRPTVQDRKSEQTRVRAVGDHWASETVLPEAAREVPATPSSSPSEHHARERESCSRLRERIGDLTRQYRFDRAAVRSSIPERSCTRYAHTKRRLRCIAESFAARRPALAASPR